MDIQETTFLTIAGTIVSGLAGAVVALWKMHARRYEAIEKKHEKAREDLTKLTGEVGNLKGRLELTEAIAPKIDKLAESVLEVIKNDPDQN